MARVAENRAAAQPSSRLQREKYARMLDAATKLGSAQQFDQVQMMDVAEAAGVAIATLYRYFPSKRHLFVGVMSQQIAGMGMLVERTGDTATSRSDAAAGALVTAMQSFMRRPVLGTSMIRAINSGYGPDAVEAARIEQEFAAVLLRAMAIEVPSDLERTLIRLLIQQWFGIAQSCVNDHIDREQAESDIRLACELLLAPMAAGRG
ncbi:TetR family transcriptional regulator [Gordonia sp. CPCC 205515]|uniref:TetR family transcriptional regulator n=1 Tax=Gordonia sp. CPCC 205515 TaxID=3140791 RepID=UPI003AF3F813